MTRDLFLLFIVGFLVLSFADAVRFARKDWKTIKTRKELILAIAAMATVANFFVFILIDVLIGGDALNGKVEGGHYYLGGNHGPYHEVSHSLFVYSTVHATVTMLGMFTLVTAALIWKRRG